MISRLRRMLGRLRRELTLRRLSRRLAGSESYSYTVDYFSGNRENWTRLLGPCAGRPGLKMLEIGSFEGRSAIWVLENILTDPAAELTCVDVFDGPGGDVRFDHNLRISGLGHKVRKLTGASRDLLPELPLASYDLVYVDGSHEAASVLLDALLSWRLLKQGGTLIFDDYRWEMQRKPAERPEMAIDLFLEFTAGQYELLHKDYQVAVRKRDA